MTWGRAFEFVGSAALSYLQQRECKLGGYIVKRTHFHPIGTDPPVSVLVYVAVPGNKDWLGDASLETISHQVINTSGAAGHNIEYILRLAKFMREFLPAARDDHLFTLERIIRRHTAALKICLGQFGGDVETAPPSPNAPSSSTFQFADRLPGKKLRCVDM